MRNYFIFISFFLFLTLKSHSQKASPDLKVNFSKSRFVIEMPSDFYQEASTESKTKAPGILGSEIIEYIEKKIQLIPADNPPLPSNLPAQSEGKVKVAIIDSGFDYSNPLLAQGLWTNPDSEHAARIGWDVFDNDPLPFDYDDQVSQYIREYRKNPFSLTENPERIFKLAAYKDSHHGTSVASVLLKYCTQCQIIPIRVGISKGSGLLQILKGLKKATKLGAQIVNISLYSHLDSDPMMQGLLEYEGPQFQKQINLIKKIHAILNFVKKNPETLFVFGTGNFSQNYFAKPNPFTSKLSELSNVIVVGSLAKIVPRAEDTQNSLVIEVSNEESKTIEAKQIIEISKTVEAIYSLPNDSSFVKIASFSNYGSGVNIYAPGEKIEVIGLNNNAIVRSGNSYAAPFVSALAAQMLSSDPILFFQNAKKLKGEILDQAKESFTDITELSFHPSGQNITERLYRYNFNYVDDESFSESLSPKAAELYALD